MKVFTLSRGLLSPAPARPPGFFTLILRCRWSFCLTAAIAVILAGCASGSEPNGAPVTSSGAPTSTSRQTDRQDSQSAEDRAPSAHTGESYRFDIPAAVLRQYEGQIDSQVEGQVHEGMLGHVHPLAEDEDLHFALESPALQTPIVCELMNALSIPPDQPATYWGDQFAQLFSTGQTVRVQGVFRLWPDHAASTEETDRATSNPPHVTEIHPITAVQGGDTVLDTVKNVAPITYQGEQYAYKAPDRWGDMLSHDIQARVVRKGDTDYLELDTPQIGFNYWELKVRLVEPVTSAPGGHRFSVRIETPTRVYQEIVPCFTIEGSEADRAAAALHPDDEPVVAAIGRFDLKKLLGGYRGPPPVELCVFGINPPRLPAAGRSPARRESAGPADRSESSRRRGSESDRVAGEYQPTPEPVGAGRYADTAANGAVIGNRNSHVYHAADSPHLPAPANRVYFQSAAEAEAAGYRRSRSD